jgi:predicted PurR-regulated permease PerM
VEQSACDALEREVEAWMHMDEPRPSRAPLRVVTVALALAGAAILLPFAVPLIVAAWAAELSRPLLNRLERAWRGRRRAASAVTVLILLAIVAPLAVALGVLIAGADEFLMQLREGLPGTSLDTLFAEPSARSLPDLLRLARDVGGGGLHLVTGMVRGSAGVVVGFVVFLAGVYAFSAHGRDVRAWLESASPIPRHAFDRLAAAFSETGRGLFVGVGLTALVQGILGGIAYVLLGVPRAPLFAFLTAIAALLPSVGTALVWAPLAVVMFLKGRPVQGAILLAVGLGVISVVDNLLRPVLTHRGRLQLPPFVLFLAMLGGVVLFGPAGIALGPLFVRLALEAIAIASSDRLWE